jgi:alpha-L-rhamnosidase
MYRTLAGVSAAEPGYRKILIAPTPGNGITTSDYRHETPYGGVAAKWTSTADGFTLDVEIPPNTTATIRLPATNPASITESGTLVQSPDLTTANGATTFTVASGTYHFRTR